MGLGFWRGNYSRLCGQNDVSRYSLGDELTNTRRLAAIPNYWIRIVHGMPALFWRTRHDANEYVSNPSGKTFFIAYRFPFIWRPVGWSRVKRRLSPITVGTPDKIDWLDKIKLYWHYLRCGLSIRFLMSHFAFFDVYRYAACISKA